MPKRRMTPARKAQIAKWQRAGAKAKKAKATGTPTGKNSLLFHRTDWESASKVVREQRFRRQPFSDGPYVYFTRPSRTFDFTEYGPAMLSVSVPRKLVQKNPEIAGTFRVSFKNLRGRKITAENTSPAVQNRMDKAKMDKLWADFEKKMGKRLR